MRKRPFVCRACEKLPPSPFPRPVPVPLPPDPLPEPGVAPLPVPPAPLSRDTIGEADRIGAGLRIIGSGEARLEGCGG